MHTQKSKIYSLLALSILFYSHIYSTSQEATALQEATGIQARQNSTAMCLTSSTESLEQIFTISSASINMAKYFNFHLNFSPFFKITNLLDPQKMRDELLTPFLGNGKQMRVKSEDGININFTFFDRKSDTLLIVGTGFGNEREKVAPFVHMFDKYDIVIFDYRGHGYDKPKLLDAKQWGVKPSEALTEILQQTFPFVDQRKIPNLDLTQTTFGQSEEKDLFAIINKLKKQKNYNKTYGIGLCFSSFIFAKAAALNPNVFDKLILDSSLYSPKQIIERVIEHPQLIFDPQRSQWSTIIENKDQKKIFEKYTQSKWFQDTVKTFAQNTLGKINITSKTTGEYLSKIEQTPILFFHGKNDKMTLYNQDFIPNWNSAFKTKEKTAVIFETGTHLTNNIKYKELYKMICDLFFELPHSKFITTLSNTDQFIEFKLKTLQSETSSFLETKIK